MEFSVGGPKWESIAASEERREKELKAAESITWATSHTEVEEAAFEEAMATVAALEAEAAPAVDVRAIWSENANAWVQNESASAAAAAALPLPTEAIPAVTVAAVVATAATKWRRRERHLRQAQLQLYLDRRQLVEKGGWLVCARIGCIFLHMHMRACVRACVHGRAFTPRRLRNECATARRPNDGAPARRQREAPATQRARRRGGGGSSQPQPQPVTT